MWENGVWVGFSRGFSRFPYHKFHSTISPHSSHPFHFISSVLVMVRQAWSAGTLAIHWPTIQGLHRISSLDPTLCWTRVELRKCEEEKNCCTVHNVSATDCFDLYVLIEKQTRAVSGEGTAAKRTEALLPSASLPASRKTTDCFTLEDCLIIAYYLN